MKNIFLSFSLLFSSLLFSQSNGLFESGLKNKGIEVISVTGDTIRLNPTKKMAINRIFIFSINNENKDFYVEIIIDKTKEGNWPVLAVNNKYFKAGGIGSSGKIYSVSFTVNREQADEISKAFNVPCNLRKHFGHALEYEFVPLKEDYKTNDSVYVKFKIINTGNVSVWYNHGGMYRNSNGRCDYFDFEVYYNDILLPDEGPEWNFGGLEAHPELKPGQTDTLTECITKWSHFRKPGKYTIKCIYHLHLQNEWNTKDYPDNQEGLHKAWDEKVEKIIEIVIK